VSSRKKNLLLIQITIFLVASALLYNTYSDKSTNERKSFVKIEAETSPETNSFTDIEYSGFDLNGNRYVLKAVQANFETETPQIINMKIVKADFFLKDEGVYNNVTLDMEFTNNVKADYLTHTIFSDLLSYTNSKAKLIATGNVIGESIEKGEFSADNVEYDMKNKTLNFSMFSNKQVEVKIKN
jgi:lipopolysaccharide assembly outer membrane protein LptD (OstA)